MECEYTEAVMHFAFDNWQLAVPRMSVSVLTSLHPQLFTTKFPFSLFCFEMRRQADYTCLELLRDCICRKCSQRTNVSHTKPRN